MSTTADTINNDIHASFDTAKKPMPEKHKLDWDQFVAMLEDPNVPVEQLEGYLTVEVDPNNVMQPRLVTTENVREASPSPEWMAQGAVGVNLLNGIYQRRRIRRFNTRLREEKPKPVLFAEGDSWFQYPLFLKDTIDHLSSDYNIYCVSAAGDELQKMVEQEQYLDKLDDLKFSRGLDVKAFLLSAGGNDIVGDELEDFLADFQEGRSAEEYLDTKKFNDKVATMTGQYVDLINKVRSEFPGLPIVLHGYDEIIPLPQQRRSLPPKDGWLGKPMRAKGITDAKLQRDICKSMIQRLEEKLIGLAGGNHDGRFKNVYLVDNIGTVKNRWNDELHPTDAGFRSVANNFDKLLKTII